MLGTQTRWLSCVQLIAALVAVLLLSMPRPADAQCWGECGTQAPEGCWCDSLCTGAGDCCPDFDICKADDGTCELACGGFGDSCWCDDMCQSYGDCCTDKISLCGDIGTGCTHDLNCDDGDACTDDFCNPGAVGTCEHVVIPGEWWYRDYDYDGYSDGLVGELACEQPPGTTSYQFVTLLGDCDESDPDVHPFMPETCFDGVDSDCDGSLQDDDFEGCSLSSDHIWHASEGYEIVVHAVNKEDILPGDPLYLIGDFGELPLTVRINGVEVEFLQPFDPNPPPMFAPNYIIIPVEEGMASGPVSVTRADGSVLNGPTILLGAADARVAFEDHISAVAAARYDAEWEDWMLDDTIDLEDPAAVQSHYRRFGRAHLRQSLWTQPNGDRPVFVAYDYYAPNGPYAWDEPWASEAEHMQAIEDLLNHVLPGYRFEVRFGQIDWADVQILANNVGDWTQPWRTFSPAWHTPLGSSPPRTIRLANEGAIGHEMSHVLGTDHHYEDPPGVERNLVVPPNAEVNGAGDVRCTMNRSTGWCSACGESMSVDVLHPDLAVTNDLVEALRCHVEPHIDCE